MRQVVLYIQWGPKVWLPYKIKILFQSQIILDNMIMGFYKKLWSSCSSAGQYSTSVQKSVQLFTGILLYWIRKAKWYYRFAPHMNKPFDDKLSLQCGV